MKGILFLNLLFSASLCHGHARLKASAEIKIRSNNAGVKAGPCGPYPRVAQPAVLKAGQSIVVNWEETIYHPGRFEFYFSQGGDANFQLLKTVENTQKGQPLPHQYSTTLTIPNISCDQCTLQMIQVMAENPSNPTYYYSCADMQVQGMVPGTPTPTPTPTPLLTPTPGPTLTPTPALTPSPTSGQDPCGHP